MNIFSLRLIILSSLLVLVVISSAFGSDNEWTALRDLSPEMRACLLESYTEKELHRLETGKPRRKDRWKLESVLSLCEAKLDPKAAKPYDGPLFDAMTQIDKKADVNGAMKRVRASGVAGIALFARSKKKLHQDESLVLGIRRKNPGFVILGAPKYFKFGKDMGKDYIRATINGVKKHDYRFVGEVLYTHADKRGGRTMPGGETYMDPTLPGTYRFLEKLAPLNIPFMTHFEPYAQVRDMKRFHKLYDDFPDQIFIMPHMGFAKAEIIEEFMARHPNLYMIISKRVKHRSMLQDEDKYRFYDFKIQKGATLKPKWKRLFLKYPDRFLFGTDPHKADLWERYGDFLDMYRLLLGQLPRDVAEKIAYRNAERLYKFKIKQ